MACKLFFIVVLFTACAQLIPRVPAPVVLNPIRVIPTFRYTPLTPYYNPFARFVYTSTIMGGRRVLVRRVVPLTLNPVMPWLLPQQPIEGEIPQEGDEVVDEADIPEEATEAPATTTAAPETTMAAVETTKAPVATTAAPLEGSDSEEVPSDPSAPAEGSEEIPY